MKAKKPLLVLVVTLALLAVALILPAAGYGKAPDNPVAWVNAYTNSNHTTVDQYGAKISLSADVKLLGSGELVGNVVNKVYMFGGGLLTFVLHPVKSEDWTVFSEDVAQFVVEDESGTQYLLVLIDNGEPSTDDSVFRYEQLGSGWDWDNPFGGPVTGGNVQIHLSKGYLP
jgi:hypothetical protein